MDRPAVGLRLPKLPILLAALRIVILSRQFQTFVPAISKERTIPMRFVFFSHTSLSPVDAGILAPLTNADDPFLSVAAIYSTKFEM